MKIAQKLILSILLMTLVMASAMTYFIYVSSASMLKQEIEQRLATNAYHMLDKIDRMLYERSSDIRAIASDPVISSKTSTPENITKRLIDFRNSYKAYVSLSFIDTDGIKIADTSGIDIGKNVSNKPYWKKAIKNGTSLAEIIDYPQNIGFLVIYFSGLVKDAEGSPIGVVVARTPVSKLYHAMKGAPRLFGTEKDLKIDLVDKNGLLLYSNTNKKGILKDNYSDLPPVKHSMSGEIMGSLPHYDPVRKEEDLCFFARERGYLNFPGNGWTLLVQMPEKEAFEPVIRLRNQISFVFLWLSIILAIGVFIIIRKIAAPIKKLEYGAKVLGAGNLDFRTEITAKDEIGELSSTFNEMAEKLEKKEKALVREIESRKTAEEATKRYADQLQSANKELEAFSYSVSHDLRAPLRSMDGFSHILLERYPDRLDEKGKDYLYRVGRAAKMMDQLIEDILTLSRVSRHEIKHEEVDLSKMAEMISSHLHSSDPGRDVYFSIQPSVAFYGDKNLLGIVIQNLLDNAWKFTGKREKATIAFGTTETEHGKTCFVRDNGTGFDMQYADKLFGAFQRLHSSVDFPGTGVGLATVKRIISRLGGKIWADAEMEKGATFYFTLPEK